MRSFRFRLDPVIRLKKYEIDHKEAEIAEIDQEIQRILQEIEEGRQHVLEMRRRLMEDVSDENYLREEQSLDLFQHYMKQVETEKRNQIQSLEETKQQKRSELLRLYQEDKILERYKEKKQTEWQREIRRQESQQMDEIGIQSYLRKEKNRGGVLLYLIVPLIVGAAALALGLYTKTIDKEVFKDIPYLGQYIQSATDTQQVVSATTEEDITLTLEEVLGSSPDTTMSQALQNIQNKIEDLNELQARLKEKEEELVLREQLNTRTQQQINDAIEFASQQIEVRRDLERQIRERKQSELSQTELKFSDALKKMDSKQAATLLANTWTTVNDPAAVGAQPEMDPETGKPKLTDNQKIVLRLMHRLEQKQITEFITDMTKNDETAAVATDIMSRFLSTNMDTLLDVKPIPAPEPIFLDEEITPATGTVSADTQPLPPPEQRTAGG